MKFNVADFLVGNILGVVMDYKRLVETFRLMRRGELLLFFLFLTKLQTFNGFFSGCSILVISDLRGFDLLERSSSFVPIILKTRTSRTVM